MATNDFINQNYTLSPLDRAVISAVLATELGKDKYNTPQDRELVLNTLFNRHAFGPYTAFGSTYRDDQGKYLFPGSPGYLNKTGRPETLNTLANIGLKHAIDEKTGKSVSQFSGLQDLQNLYQSTLPVEDQIKQIEALMKDNKFYNEMFQYIDPYVKARMEAGGKGIGETANAFNFINAMVEGDPRKNYDLWTASKSDRQLFGKKGDIPSGYKSPGGVRYAHIPFYNPLYVSGKYKLDNDPTIHDNLLRLNYLPAAVGSVDELSEDGIGVGAGAGVTDYDSAAREVYLRDMANQAASYTPEIPWSDPRGPGPDNWEVPSELPFSSFFGPTSQGLPRYIPPKIAPTMKPDNKGIMEAIKRGGRQIGRQMRGALGYADGTTGVDPYLNNAIFGSQWGPQHDAMLENSIEGFRKRFPQATNEQVIAAISPSILKDIDAQVGHMNMNPSSQFTGRPPASQTIDVPPIRNINSGPHSDTVPALLTPGEAVIPREVAQDPAFMDEIREMIDLGRERQNRQDLEEGIDMALDEVNVKAPVPQQYINDGSDFSLPKSKKGTGFKKRMGEWWDNVGDITKDVFYPFGPGGASNPTLKEEEVQPKQPWTDPRGPGPDNWEVPKVPWKDPQVGPDTWEVPGYTMEEKEKQNNAINELPKDDLLEQRMLDLDRDELERVVTDAKKYADANAFKFKDVTNWIEKNLGFNKQDLYRALLYYVGGRLTGGSHAGSLRWAGRAVIEEASARGTAVAKAQATAQGDMMKAMTDEAKQKLKDGYFTRAGSKLINTAIRAQDFTTLNTLLADTQNPSLYNQMAMISDLSKRKPYYIKGTNPLNNMIMAPHKEKNVYIWQDPSTGLLNEIPMDQVEEYKADIHYDNMFNKYANDFKGYQAADKLDAKNKNTDYKKLGRHYNTSSASAFRTKIKAISEKYNVSPDRVFSMVTRLLEITPDNLEQEDLNTDLESAMASLIIDPMNLPDNDKLKDFNQEDINKMVEDFGGDPKTVTKHIQTVDTFLAGNPEATPPIPQKLVKDIKHEEVDADIDKAAIDNDIKIKLKALPNPYWKMVYLEFYTSKG